MNEKQCEIQEKCISFAVRIDKLRKHLILIKTIVNTTRRIRWTEAQVR